MAKTFNRSPLQVNTPSSSDIKNYFFNHYNWKGVNNDKNFLAVDQETFADAKNVYADAEGLLRSRPSVKQETMFFDSAIDFWNFDDVDVYFRKENDSYILYFVTNNIAYSKSINSEKVKLVKVQNYIYCFVENDFFYFDVNQKVFGDGFDKVYIPNTVFNATGVKEKIESKNILTGKEKHTYLYNAKFGISTEAYGKSLTVKINNKEYETVFDEFTEESLVDVLFDLPNEYDGLIVSPKDTYLFYSIENRVFAYSASGKVISKSFILPQEYGIIISKPRFSQDGNYVAVATENSVYIVSVVADSSTGTYRFEDFTDVSSYTDNMGWPTPQSVYADFDFATYDSFVIAVNYKQLVGDTLFSKILLINRKNSDSEDFITNHVIDASLDKLKVRYSDNLEMCLLFTYNIGLDVNASEYQYRLYDFRNLESFVFIDSGTFNVVMSDFNTDIKIINNKILFTKNYVGRNDLTIVNIERTDEGINFEKELSVEYDYDYRFKKHVISSDGSKIFTGKEIYYIKSGEYKEVFVNDASNEPVYYTNYIYFINNGTRVFSSLIENTLEFNYIVPGENNLFSPDLLSRLNNFYLTSGKELYISDYREEDGEFRWYLPEVNKQGFDFNITGLHPISTSEMGIFFNDEIWYGYLSEQGYRYTKSKLELGVKFGSDIITSYDGSQLIFPTERGIAVLSYQDFVASTDQIITFLSDAVHSSMKEFCKKPVLLFKNDYWIIVYSNNSEDIYVLDSRNSSWWPWSLMCKTKKFIKYNDDLILHSTDGKFYRFDKSNEDYFDYDGVEHPIEWNVTSQKLHFSQPNNHKHIVNMTFNSIIDTENLSFFLDIKNYREYVDVGKTENPHFSVDVLRTFVQRLNYFKVNEFQYTIRSDKENEHPLPLSLSSMSIKYKVQGQVR